MNVEIIVGDVLFVNQLVESSIKGLTLEDRVSFTQSANQNIHTRELSAFIKIVHLPLVGKTIALELAQTISFEEVAIPRAFAIGIDQQFFAWSDMIAEPLSPLVHQVLSLGETLSCDKATGIYDVLSISQDVFLETTRNLTIEQTLSMLTPATVYKPDKYWTSYEIEVVQS